jgi:hypothetical protein
MKFLLCFSFEYQVFLPLYLIYYYLIWVGLVVCFVETISKFAIKSDREVEVLSFIMMIVMMSLSSLRIILFIHIYTFLYI